MSHPRRSSSRTFPPTTGVERSLSGVDISRERHPAGTSLRVNNGTLTNTARLHGPCGHGKVVDARTKDARHGPRPSTGTVGTAGAAPSRTLVGGESQEGE